MSRLSFNFNPENIILACILLRVGLNVFLKHKKDFESARDSLAIPQNQTKKVNFKTSWFDSLLK